MASSSEKSRANTLVDLQGLIQSISAQRRSGELTVSSEGDSRKIRFKQGQICATLGTRSDLLLRALCWAGVTTRERMHPVISNLPPGTSPHGTLALLMERGIVDANGALDAMDVLVEEEFTNLLTWNNPSLEFADRFAVDPWADMQISLGVSVSAPSVLLECLRRQDELASVSSLIPNAWDTLMRVPEIEPKADLHEDAKVFLIDWKDGIPCGAYLESYRMPTFRATRAIVALRKEDLVRVSDVSEMVLQGDAARALDNRRKAFGLYRRALALGHDTPRIRLLIAELAEYFEDKALAAESCLAAAANLSDPAAASAALHNALRLGADRENTLLQLMTLHVTHNENDKAVNALMELARIYERKGAHDQAVQALREAQGLGADSATTGLMLARLSVALGDLDQATLQLELAARALHESERMQEAVTAWRELVRLQPTRCDYARECAELMIWSGEKDQAVEVLRISLALQRQQGFAVSEELLLTMYELLAKLDPSEVMAHDWLAKAYERRRDRDGATAQLRLAASAQEKAGDDLNLARTLERILGLDPHQVDALEWQAKVRLRLKQDAAAAVLWSKAVDAALAQGLRKEARAMLEGAVTKIPSSHHLRSRLALVANRDGDRAEAIAQYEASANLASGCGDREAAKELLVQATRLKPDDLWLRVRLAEVCEVTKDANLERTLAEVVRIAVRTSNHGIALEHARKRIVLMPSVEARSELIELLRRTGDHVGELAAGHELLAELFAASRFEEAIELLSRLVASHNKDADLVLQLAEAYNNQADAKQAVRCYRHAVVLLQTESRIEDARDVLDQVAALSEEPEAIDIARERLDQGVPVDWERIRAELSQGLRRKSMENLSNSGLFKIERRPPIDQHLKPVSGIREKIESDPAISQ